MLNNNPNVLALYSRSSIRIDENRNQVFKMVQYVKTSLSLDRGDPQYNETAVNELIADGVKFLQTYGNTIDEVEFFSK